jgi:glycosyltransferase involved in cell wall biosynthesis
MAASRLVVVPLRGGVLEPGGRQVFENAMALGKAVVVADDSGAGDYLEHMVSGILVPSGDVAALRQAVQILLHDPSLARALAANAREAAKAFTPERFFAQVFALADACLKERKEVF